MSDKRNKDDWWLDRWIWRLVAPLIAIIPKRNKERSKEKKVTKRPYGSSELCYCGSDKKYKHCCKKENKKLGKVAIKITRRTRNGVKEKVKVVREATLPKSFFSGSFDSGMDPNYFDA